MKSKTRQINSPDMNLTLNEQMEAREIENRFEGLRLIQATLLSLAESLAKTKATFFFKLLEARGLNKFTNIYIEKDEIKIKDEASK